VPTNNMSLTTPRVGATDLQLHGDCVNVLAARGDAVHLVRNVNGSFEGGELKMDTDSHNYTQLSTNTPSTGHSTIPVVWTPPANPVNGTIIINASRGYRIETYTTANGWVRGNGDPIN